MSIKAEKQKFYDDLLAKILVFGEMQDMIKEFREDTEWNKKHGWTERNFEEQALENLFEDIFKNLEKVPPEIWEKVKEAIRGKVEDVTFDLETFAKEGYWLKLEDIVNDVLEETQEELEDALKRKHSWTTAIKYLH